jgi:acetyl esterase/lipase
MIRLLLTILFFLVSLLVLFPPPIQFAWFISVAVAAYTVGFVAVSLMLLLWNAKAKRYKAVGISLSIITLVLYCVPIVRAYTIGSKLDERLKTAYGFEPGSNTGFHQPKPFSFGRIFSGTEAKKIIPAIYEYAKKDTLSLQLKFYPSPQAGTRPCLVMVHGGAWHSGSFDELPEVDNYYANAGYQVASINYRLSPKYNSPAPIEDVRDAIKWLCDNASKLNIDTTNFLLMGRSAGGQIVLTAAYTLKNPNIKGVAGYYGPTDMIWSYANPASPLVLNSGAALREYFGGTPQEYRQRYFDASAMQHVTAATVPTLLVTGDNDAHVWSLQQTRLAVVLDQYKVPNMVLEIPWASHGCEYHLSGSAGQLCTYVTERFFWKVTH